MILFKCNKKKSAGFTLIELMVVIAIIAIVSAFAIPSFSRSEHKVKKVAREIMGSMQRARMLAVKTNSDVAIVFDSNLSDGTNTSRYAICTDPGGDGVWSTITGNTTVEIVEFTWYDSAVQYSKLSPGLAVTYGGLPGYGVLTFNSRGTCSAGFVYIAVGNHSYKIGTQSTGIIRIHRWNGSSYS